MSKVRLAVVLITMIILSAAIYIAVVAHFDYIDQISVGVCKEGLLGEYNKTQCG